MHIAVANLAQDIMRWFSQNGNCLLATQVDSWTASPIGVVKINVDGSGVSQHCTGSGGLIWDASGH